VYHLPKAHPLKELQVILKYLTFTVPSIKTLAFLFLHRGTLGACGLLCRLPIQAVTYMWCKSNMHSFYKRDQN